MKEKNTGLTANLTQVSEAKSRAMADKGHVESQKEALGVELGHLRGQLSSSEAQIEAGKERELELKRQVQHLSEVSGL